ncbi:hypothetical protein H5410_027211 [Solanum commersonii]|uniref:Uncharacterized protein n=1 Tax=Solanum commersonii TaxID=4109 RepID=A0A9J5Z1C0_SOLCO|nr:hypothetical protein H5410_027211 [Solanum commersonii]
MNKTSHLVRVRSPGGCYGFGIGGEAEVVSAIGNMIDGSGLLSTLISGNLAEKMVSITTTLCLNISPTNFILIIYFKSNSCPLTMSKACCQINSSEFNYKCNRGEAPMSRTSLYQYYLT